MTSRAVLTQLVVRWRRSWGSRELAGSIPAMATGFTQTITKGTWLEELDYVNDQFYVPKGSNSYMLPGELMLVQGYTGPHSHCNNAVKVHQNGITLVQALYKYTLLFL